MTAPYRHQVSFLRSFVPGMLIPETGTSFDFGQTNQKLPPAVYPSNTEAKRNGSLLKTQRPVLPKLEPPLNGIGPVSAIPIAYLMLFRPGQLLLK